MAQINDIVKIRSGGSSVPYPVTVLEIDINGIPIRVRDNENAELSAAEFVLWNGPDPKFDPRLGKLNFLSGRTLNK